MFNQLKVYLDITLSYQQKFNKYRAQNRYIYSSQITIKVNQFLFCMSTATWIKNA